MDSTINNNNVSQQYSAGQVYEAPQAGRDQAGTAAEENTGGSSQDEVDLSSKAFVINSRHSANRRPQVVSLDDAEPSSSNTGVNWDDYIRTPGNADDNGTRTGSTQEKTAAGDDDAKDAKDAKGSETLSRDVLGSKEKSRYEILKETQEVIEQLQYERLTLDNQDEYNAILDDLAANGINLDVDDKQKAEDLQSSQALLAAASVGVLDYEALASVLDEAGSGSLSALIGEKLLEAHNSGTPLERIDFGTNMLQPITASPGGESFHSSDPQKEIDRQIHFDRMNAQGLRLAAERGLIDSDAVKSAVDSDTYDMQTGRVLRYIADVESKGGDYAANPYNQYREPGTWDDYIR